MNNNRKYFIESVKLFFDNFWEKRLNFINRNKYIYKLISIAINKSINTSDKVLLLCSANYLIKEEISCNSIHIHEVNNFFKKNPKQNEKYIDFNNYDDLNFEEYDHIIIADLEYQSDPNNNLNFISKKIKDDTRITVISKSILWFLFSDIVKKIFFIQAPSKHNFLPFYFLKNMFEINNFNILKNNKVIFFPFYIPIISHIINCLFKIPILNFLCAVNVTVIKKNNLHIRNVQEKLKISVIIPCKNEEGNINAIHNEMINLGFKTEYLFGDDKSSDNTRSLINSLVSNDQNIEIKSYDGPGICKSSNVYKGIEYATGDVIVIFDADLTVKMNDIKLIINNYLNESVDFINCTRMIYPQGNLAMKKSNFLGNIIFAFLFSVLMQQKITDTLCGTKIFYKKDWCKINKYCSKWGLVDLWGDFDLLLGAYKNNLKIVDIPVKYFDRVEGQTKMTSVFKNGLRMLYIVIVSFYKLRIK